MGATNREAYEKSGYEAKNQNSADATASELLKNPKVNLAVSDVFAEHAQQLGKKWSLSKDKIIKDFELLKKEGIKRGQLGPAAGMTLVTAVLGPGLVTQAALFLG